MARARAAVLAAFSMLWTAAAVPPAGSFDPGPVPPATPSTGSTGSPVELVVDAATPIGPANQALRGVGWNTGSLDGVAPLEPPTVRIDASLHVVARDGLDALHLDPLLERISAVVAVGAEPVVILSYMPEWLAATGPGDPRDPTRVRPADLDVWQELVERVVSEAAAAGAGAFEVWNEPDLPVFWQDTPDAFLETALATHRAVAAVEASTGHDLAVGGPATAFPDPAFIVPYVAAVRDAQLSLDFVSWHYYGNHPLLGPDGAEATIPPEAQPAYPVAGRRNPATTPRVYRLQAEMVRGWVDAALAGSHLDPILAIDEWNVSAGGLDRRHDTHEGAAFALGTLIEMEAGGLDAADFYRAADDPSNADARVGDWGLVDRDGRAKPTWWIFEAWRAADGERLLVESGRVESGRVESGAAAGAPDVFARATTRQPGAPGGRIDVLVASFDASGTAADRRPVRVEVAGRCVRSATVALVDGPDDDFSPGAFVPLVVDRTGGRDAVEFDLPSPSAAWLRLAGGCP